MKILIIGGNRFSGKQLSNELVLRGNEVDVFNRSGTGISNVNIIQGDRNNKSDLDRTVSVETSIQIRGLMRLAVVEGTGKNADVLGYEVGGKTGTARIYEKGIGYTTKSKRTTFLGIFPSSQPKYLTLVLLERPQPLAEDHLFNYAAYNSAKITAKIIERIGPILAINFPQNPSMNNLNVLSPVVFKR